MKHRWTFTTVVVCLASASARGGTYHVATSGNDTNAGTQAAPFRTIQRAASAVSAGDDVVVHAGTYAGFLVTTSSTYFHTDGAVAIDGATTGNRDAIRVSGASYVTIEGFSIHGATRAGISAETCSHITIRGNHVDQNGRWGVFSSHCDDFVVEDNEVSRSGTEHGIYASNSADRPVIRRNLIWGNGMCGVHMNGDINFGGDGVISGAVIEANIIRDNGALGGSGINGDGVTGALVRNNVLDGNHASGISLYRIDGGAASTGNQIINNTIRMASDARWAVNIQDGSTGNVLRNNILLHPNAARGAVDLCATCGTGMLSNHNAVVGRFSVGGTVVDLAGWRSRTGGDGASFVATEAQLFASATDLSLPAGSAAIDQGEATGAPATDVTGVARPQGAAVDIGAYEYSDAVVEPPTDPSPDPDPDPPGTTDPDPDDPDDDYYSSPPVDMSSGGGCNAVGTPGWLLVPLLALVRRRRVRGSRGSRSSSSS